MNNTHKIGSSLYNRLFEHCQKQYKNILQINKAYLVGNKVYAVEFERTDGLTSIPSNTAIAERIICFEE